MLVGENDIPEDSCTPDNGTSVTPVDDGFDEGFDEGEVACDSDVECDEDDADDSFLVNEEVMRLMN